jgi:uncharacterized protein YebE (UPF0316 family)
MFEGMNEYWTVSGVYAWVVLPLLIFISRIADVTIGTIRLIFVSRGLKVLAPLAGFFEVLIWLVVIGQIMRHLANPLCYIAYAAGFATGNYVGMYLVEKLSLGMVIIRIITQKDASSLVESLNQRQFGVTVLDGRGAKGKVQVIFTVVKRAHVQEVQDLIQKFHPMAFYSIEEVGDVQKGIFPMKKGWKDIGLIRILMPFRKSK